MRIVVLFNCYSAAPRSPTMHARLMFHGQQRTSLASFSSQSQAAYDKTPIELRCFRKPVDWVLEQNPCLKFCCQPEKSFQIGIEGWSTNAGPDPVASPPFLWRIKRRKTFNDRTPDTLTTAKRQQRSISFLLRWIFSKFHRIPWVSATISARPRRLSPVAVKISTLGAGNFVRRVC